MDVPPEHRMRQVCRGLYLIPVLAPTLPPAKHTNCVIIGEDELYVVDPAATDPEEQKRVVEQIESLRGPTTKVAAVLLTHGHPDHIGSATLVRDRYEVPIWAHAETAAEMDFSVDRCLNDDEVISVAGSRRLQLRCLYTPGHHPGHLCFLEESSRTLIAGDMVAGGSSIVIAQDYGGDMSAYLASLRRLLEIPCTSMIPSHGSILSEPRKVLEKQIEYRLARERKIKAALQTKPTTFQQLLAASYGDVPQEKWEWAAQTLRAHLVRLGADKFFEP